MSFKGSFRRALLVGAALSSITIHGAATAQDATTDEDVIEVIEETVEDEARQEKIVVTGSLLQRDEFASASPVQVITAEVAALEGLIDSAAILQGSSLASGSTQINNQFGGFVVDGGTGVQTVDLRGCGPTRNLTLINGKRPGPSGTRGAVGAFDFNNIPGSMVQRYDILKDSGSTIYGSDAVCGVINVITRTSIDAPEFSFTVLQPFDSGGEQYAATGGFGLDFENGSFAIGAEWNLSEDLSLGDRSYLDCEQDLVFDTDTGEQRDRVNRSVTFDANDSDRRHCGNIYINTAIDLVTGDRLVPSPDGITGATGVGGVIPGYRPRANGRYDDFPGAQAFYEDVLEDPRYLSTDAINRTERISLYGVADFDFDMLGGLNSRTEGLFTKRETTAEGWRQFFPDIRGVGVFGGFFAYQQDPTYVNPLNSVVLPVILWPSNRSADVEYSYVAQTLSGGFGNTGFLSDWAWELGANYSYSDGTYENNAIIASQTGDYGQFGTAGLFEADRDVNGNVITLPDGTTASTRIAGSGFAPTLDYFTADFLAGNYSDAAFQQLTSQEVGNTVYEQTLVQGHITGEAFELPAGKIGMAVGFEYRTFSINDVPGEKTRGELVTFTDPVDNQSYTTRVSDIWGSSSAGITKGDDSVAEIFAEVEVPLFKGQPFAEEVTLNVSGRTFEYDSFGSDSVYKAGLNWQINPSVRVRATNGTSYRAPQLFELFLGNQTGFQGQNAIDPCFDLTTQTNQNIITNCAADGVPQFNLGSSAIIISGGGAGQLQPETSTSSTIGLIYTPTFADLSMALDYYEIEIEDQIAQLGPSTILTGCYAGDNFPNAFCDLFTRAPANDPAAPGAVLTVQDQYLNVNSQTFRGVDFEIRYVHEFDFGELTLDGDASWAFERNTQLFAPDLVAGFDQQDFNGTVGAPSVTGNFDAQLKRGDLTYRWFTYFVGRASNARFADAPGGIGETYFGEIVNVDYSAEAVYYHGISLRWKGDTMSVTAGIRNLFNEAPPTLSSEGATLRGQVPLVGSQYDLRGRRGFVTVSKTF